MIEDLLLRLSQEQAVTIMEFAGIDGNLSVSGPLTSEVRSQVKALT